MSRYFMQGTYGSPATPPFIILIIVKGRTNYHLVMVRTYLFENWFGTRCVIFYCAISVGFCGTQTVRSAFPPFYTYSHIDPCAD